MTLTLIIASTLITALVVAVAWLSYQLQQALDANTNGDNIHASIIAGLRQEVSDREAAHKLTVSALRHWEEWYENAYTPEVAKYEAAQDVIYRLDHELADTRIQLSTFQFATSTAMRIGIDESVQKQKALMAWDEAKRDNLTLMAKLEKLEAAAAKAKAKTAKALTKAPTKAPAKALAPKAKAKPGR